MLCDEKNGFRKGRSTIDHVSSLTNIIETRKKHKLATFCEFIDFRKASDFIDRSLLWDKLKSKGFQGNMLHAIQSLYKSVSSCVRINGLTTEWFDVNCGLKQGCSNLDLVYQIKAVGK